MMKLNDDLLRSALAQVQEEEIADLSADDSPVLSPAYHRAVSRIVKPKHLASGHKIFYTVGKRVAIFVFVVLLSFTMIFSVQAVREPVGKWIRNVYDSALRAQAPEIIEREFCPGYVPAGYQLIRQSRYKLSIHYIWENEHGELLLFDQSTLHGESYVRSMGATVMELGGIRVLYYRGNNYHVYYWNTNEYEFCLSAHSALSDEEILKIIKSLRPVAHVGGES